MHKPIVLITNIWWVHHQGVRLYAHALVLEPDDEGAGGLVRGFFAGGTSPVFEVQTPGFSYELGPNHELSLPGHSFQIRPHDSKRPLDLETIEEPTLPEPYRHIWARLRAKVLHYWPAGEPVPRVVWEQP